MNNSDKIWNDIKDKQVNMFSLPSKKVSECCERITVDPDKCYLKSSITAFLPALEEVLKNEYQCDQAYKYIIISKLENKPKE